MKLFFAYWMLSFLLLSPNTSCGGIKIMPEEQTHENHLPPENDSIPVLEKFIFHTDIFKANVVPRKLSPEKVAKFLLEKVDAKATLKNFVQIERVVVFYEIFEVAGKFKQFLAKQESDVDSVRRSIVITRIISRIGTSEEVSFAKEYYKYLVGRALTKEEFEELILLYDSFGPGGDATVLQQRIKTRMAELEAKKETDEASRVAYLEFAGTLTNKLLRAEKAQAVKAKILEMADRKKRIEAEIKAYLAIEYGYTEYLEPWSATRLRRETWAAQPAEQIKRNEQSIMREDVAKLLRSFVEKIGKIKEIEPDEEEFARIRLLRGIKFFDGKVTAREEELLSEHKNDQLDVLANEGFQISE